MMENIWTRQMNIDSLLRSRQYAASGKMILLSRYLEDNYLKKNVIIKQVLKRVSLKNSLEQEWQTNTALMKRLGAWPPPQTSDLTCLPPHSFVFSFEFQLTTPWYSRDDTPLYPMENPVRKEWVFKMPEMSAAGWKGIFLAASRAINLKPDVVVRFFGEASDDDTGSSGCLKFFPSFFDQVEYITLAPHDRKTRAGRKKMSPIYLEVVPQKSKSLFTLLYIADPKNDQQTITQDRRKIAFLTKEVFYNQRFGAKTSSGFGRAKIIIPKKKQ